MQLWDLSQAAAELHCSERWLADNLRSGRFPAKKIGRKWMLSDDDIAAILQICSVNHSFAFSADPSVSVAPSSSMTKTTFRRLQQSSNPR
jgi:Helix-turn-helix domain